MMVFLRNNFDEVWAYSWRNLRRMTKEGRDWSQAKTFANRTRITANIGWGQPKQLAMTWGEPVSGNQ